MYPTSNFVSFYIRKTFIRKTVEILNSGVFRALVRNKKKKKNINLL